MGSKRLQVLVLAAIIGVMAWSPNQGAEMEKKSFGTKEEIEKWAKGFFFGGYDLFSFAKIEKAVIVLVGSHTSGVPTSETYFFVKTKKGIYSLIIVREAVTGILKAIESPEGIEIRTEKEKLILFVPWFGIAEDFDYFK